MELHQPHRLVAPAGQHAGQAAGHVRLAGAGHPLQDELLLQFQQLAGLAQPVAAERGGPAEVGLAVARAGRRAARLPQEGQRVVGGGAGVQRRQPVEGQQDLARQLVAGQERVAGGQEARRLQGAPAGPGAQVGGGRDDALRRPRLVAEAAPQGAAALQDAEQHVAVLGDALAQSLPGGAGRPGEAQAEAHPGGVEADEELHAVAPAARRAPAEDDPEGGVVGPSPPVGVAVDAGQGPAAAGRRVQVPAAQAAQHRLDVAPRQRPAQLDQRRPHGEAVAAALALQPGARVVVRQVGEEAEGVGAEAVESGQ